MAALMKANQNVNEKNRPADEKKRHEPMAELEDVIDLKAVLGSIRLLAEKFVNERERPVTHIFRDLLPPIPDAVRAACGCVSKDENQTRRNRRAPT